MSSLTPHISTHRRRDARPRQASPIGLRMRVFLRRGRLDAMLAGGAPCGESPELVLRASQLSDERNRRHLAGSLEAIVRAAHGRGQRRSARPSLATRDVRATSTQIMRLARDLRECPQVTPAGVAMTQRLLTDGSGPLYVYGQDDALWRAVRDASAALHGV